MLKRRWVYNLLAAAAVNLCLLLGAGVRAAGVQASSATLKVMTSVADGSALAGARVHLEAEGREPREGMTDQSGTHSFGGLEAGVYRMRVEAAGYRTVVAEGLTVLEGEVQELRFTLEAGGADEVVRIAPPPEPEPTPTPTTTPTPTPTPTAR